MCSHQFLQRSARAVAVIENTTDVEGVTVLPAICMFRGIKIYINYRDHLPAHFHASYGEYDCCICIEEIELIVGPCLTNS